MADPMDPRQSKFLVFYLLLGTVMSGYAFYLISSAKPVVDTKLPTPGDCAGASPKLTGLYPTQINAGSAVEVLLLGCKFDADTTTLTINGTPRKAMSVDSNYMRVELTSADVAAVGTVVVTLTKSDAGKDTEFGSGVFAIVPPGAIPPEVNLFGTWNFSQEGQVLLMVVFIGAFGSCVYALKSLADYQGETKLYGPWFSFYLIQPFEGSGIALLMYLVIRAGFLTGTGADIKAGNAFGICAIAGLAGAFSDTAFLKLREVFQTLFKPQDDRGGKVTPVSITSTALPDATVGTPYQQTLQANGGTPPLQWSVMPPLPTPLSLDQATGIISGTPVVVAPMAKYTFTVTDSGTSPASASRDLTLEIKAEAASRFDVATTALPDATVGTPYQQTLQANGGTPPLQWSVMPPLPTPLALDKTTGTISGRPAAAAPMTKYTFTVTDGAIPPTSASSDITLEIKVAAANPAIPVTDSDDIDGCDVPVEKATSDEVLPAAEGGVA